MNDSKKQYRFGVEILHEVLDALGLPGAKGATQRLVLDFAEDRFPFVWLMFAPGSEALDRLKEIDGLDIQIPAESEMRVLYEMVGLDMQREFILEVIKEALDRV